MTVNSTQDHSKKATHLSAICVCTIVGTVVGKLSHTFPVTITDVCNGETLVHGTQAGTSSLETTTLVGESLKIMISVGGKNLTSVTGTMTGLVQVYGTYTVDGTTAGVQVPKVGVNDKSGVT